MRTYVEEEVTYKRKRLAELKCDLCGTAAKTPSNENFETDYYETNETTVEIRHKEGTAYPEAHYGKERSFDVCPKCFEEKLVPWMESQGAKVREKEYHF